MDELITKRMAIDAIVNTASDVNSHNEIVSAQDGAAFRQHEIIDIINALPSAQPERKKGRWIERRDTRFGPKLNYIIICSNCNIAFSGEDMTRRSFCPNCGADMREEKTNELAKSLYHLCRTE